MDSSTARVDQQRAERSAATKHSVLEYAGVRRCIFQVASLYLTTIYADELWRARPRRQQIAVQERPNVVVE